MDCNCQAPPCPAADGAAPYTQSGLCPRHFGFNSHVHFYQVPSKDGRLTPGPHLENFVLQWLEMLEMFSGVT